MNQSMITFAILILSSLQTVTTSWAQTPPSKDGTASPSGADAGKSEALPDLVPDPKYKPQPGDRVAAFNEGQGYSFIAAGPFAYEAFTKAIQARDREGLKELINKKQLSILKDMTPILVIELHNNPFLTNNIPAAEVRILEGENKNAVVWMPLHCVNRMVEKSQLRSTARGRPIPGKPGTDKAVISPASRAASLLRAALALEKAGKTDAALHYYRRISKEFPDTPQAATASDRAKALGKPR